VSAVLGVVGALGYSFIEKKLGVRRTGLIGLSVGLIAKNQLKFFKIQQLFLWFCIVSIFLPGTLFDPAGYIDEFSFAEWWSNFKSAFQVDSPGKDPSITTTPSPSLEIDRSSMSIIFYFVGVTFARIGVWITDLSIMQIMQESIKEEDRLSVFGVENALCQFFFVGKDIMAILLPDPRTYGLLIIVSVLFVLTGFAFYLFWFLKVSREFTLFIYFSVKTRVNR
jgi:iron-regulated transporter 1